MTSTYLFYLLWALIQHSLIVAACWFLPINLMSKVLLSILLFTLCHYPNWKLMLITFLGAVIIYFTTGILYIKFSWVALGIIPLFCIGHAFIGRYLIEKGWEMRVLWLHPNWPFKSN
jgi:hypothetical protein